MICITDIHGCYGTLLKLLEKCPSGHEVVFLGDLVDRGPYSAQVVKYARENKIRCVMGNHDHMMADYFADRPSDYDHGVWHSNGGMLAERSYSYRNQMIDDAAWLGSLPPYIKEGKLFLSHTGHGDDPRLFDAIWNRSFLFPDDGLFRIFGHTPQKTPLVTETFMLIDTGAAYKRHGLGVLTALVIDPENPSDYKFVSQDYDEPPNPKDKDL